MLKDRLTLREHLFWLCGKYDFGWNELDGLLETADSAENSAPEPRLPLVDLLRDSDTSDIHHALAGIGASLGDCFVSLASLASTHAVTVQRKTIRIDSSGGPVNAWADVGGSVNVPCGIQPATAKEKLLYQQRQLKFDYKLYFGLDPAIKKGDRLKVVSAPANEATLVGQTLVVINYKDPAGRGLYSMAEAFGLE